MDTNRKRPGGGGHSASGAQMIKPDSDCSGDGAAIGQAYLSELQALLCELNRCRDARVQIAGREVLAHALTHVLRAA